MTRLWHLPLTKPLAAWAVGRSPAAARASAASGDGATPRRGARSVGRHPWARPWPRSPRRPERRFAIVPRPWRRCPRRNRGDGGPDAPGSRRTDPGAPRRRGHGARHVPDRAGCRAQDARGAPHPRLPRQSDRPAQPEPAPRPARRRDHSLPSPGELTSPSCSSTSTISRRVNDSFGHGTRRPPAGGARQLAFAPAFARATRWRASGGTSSSCCWTKSPGQQTRRTWRPRYSPRCRPRSGSTATRSASQPASG